MKISLSRIASHEPRTAMRGAIALLIAGWATFAAGCGGSYCEPGASSDESTSASNEEAEADDPCAKVEEVDRGAKP